jgi:hypothetical protein
MAVVTEEQQGLMVLLEAQTQEVVEVVVVTAQTTAAMAVQA